MVFLYKTCRRTRRISGTSPSWSYTKFHKRQMTGRVDILRHIYVKCKKSSKWSHRTGKTSFLVNLSENVKILCFFVSCDFIFNYFKTFFKMQQSTATGSFRVIKSFILFCCWKSERWSSNGPKTAKNLDFDQFFK